MPLFPVVLMVMLLAMDGIMLERNSALAVMMDKMAGLHGGFTPRRGPWCFSNLFLCVKSRRIEDVT